MFKQHRWMKLITMIVLISLVIIGCSSNNNNNNSPSNSQGQNSSDSSGSEVQTDRGQIEDGEVRVFDPTVKITAAIALRDSDKLRFGDTPEDNPMRRWFRDNMGIDVEYKWQMSDVNNALETKIRLALTSGEELPDVLYVNDEVLLSELIASGRIMSIDEVYEKYASPRTKAIYENNPDTWKMFTSDGKKWALPRTTDGIVGGPVMWIRQDWLDEVNMEAPTNIQELEAVFAAFKERYPDKTPLSVAGQTEPWNAWMGDVQAIFGGTQFGIWEENDEGKLEFGTIQPGIKDGLAKLNEFYEKGYIDPNFGTYNPEKAASEFTAGNAGMIFGPGWMGGWPLADTVENVPGAVVKPYPLPAGVDGQIGRKGTDLTSGGYVFRNGFDQFEAIFAYWDVMLGREYEDETSPFVNGFAEGYSYVMVDGEVSWEVPDGTVEIDRFALFQPGQLPPNIAPEPSIFERVKMGKSDTIYEKQRLTGSQPGYYEGMAMSATQAVHSHYNRFLGGSTPTMDDRWTLLDKALSESFIAIIHGKNSIDSFEKMVSDWREKGGDQITEEVNEWFEANK